MSTLATHLRAWIAAILLSPALAVAAVTNWVQGTNPTYALMVDTNGVLATIAPTSFALANGLSTTDETAAVSTTATAGATNAAAIRTNLAAEISARLSADTNLQAQIAALLAMSFGASTNLGGTGLVVAAAGPTNDVLHRDGLFRDVIATQSQHAITAGTAATSTWSVAAGTAQTSDTAIVSATAATAGIASNALYRYAADATAGEEVLVLASAAGITSVRSGSTLTFTIPAGVHLLSARIRFPAGVGTTLTIVTGTTDMPNTSLADRWGLACVAINETTGYPITGAKPVLDLVNHDRVIIYGLSSTAVNHILIH